MFTAIQQIAEPRIEEALKSGRGQELSHWKNKPLPLHDENGQCAAPLADGLQNPA